MLMVLLAAQAASFQSVELRGGGEVVVRPGATQSVRLVQGDSAFTRITTANGRLVIERCPDRCPRDYRSRVEVTTPSLAALAVNDGGVLRVEGSFPRRPSLAVSVSHGGGLDARALAADEVAASVSNGGIILTSAERRLNGAVAQGGRISYWGSPAVTRSVRQGGVVERGRAGDDMLRPNLPPLRPLQPLRSRHP